MAAKTTTSAAGRDLTGEIAFLTRALNAPTLRESVARLAERARSGIPVAGGRTGRSRCTQCADASRVLDAGGKWTYRYIGARLLAYANDRWFLIVAPRQRGYRSTVLTLHDADSLRIETTIQSSA